VKDGRVTDEVDLSSRRWKRAAIAWRGQRAARHRGRFTEDLIVCRHAGEVLPITPRQGRLYGRVAEAAWFRWAAALIPFLENDDANAR